MNSERIGAGNYCKRHLVEPKLPLKNSKQKLWTAKIGTLLVRTVKQRYVFFKYEKYHVNYVNTRQFLKMLCMAIPQ